MWCVDPRNGRVDVVCRSARARIAERLLERAYFCADSYPQLAAMLSPAFAATLRNISKDDRTLPPSAYGALERPRQPTLPLTSSLFLGEADWCC